MNRTKKQGVLVEARLNKAGLTLYTRMGRTVIRTARSEERRSNTEAQFDARQRLKHSTALWHCVKRVRPTFRGDGTAYNRFVSLMSQVPVVYTASSGLMTQAALLVPGIPMSEGTLPTVKQWLGEAEGQWVLFTNLRESPLAGYERLKLYTLRQETDDHCPTVSVSQRMVDPTELTLVDGHLAMTDSDFADTTMGWALVRSDGEQCSTQRVVTRCMYYATYTTEEAKQRAVRSYGGFTR